MKTFSSRSFVVAVIGLALVATATRAADIETYFSPRGGCANAVAIEVRNATTTIDLAAFQLTHPGLLWELATAAKRGVCVRVIVNADQEVGDKPPAACLKSYGVTVLTDRHEKLFHDKYCVIDGRTLLTGSFNWSINGEERNAENLLILRDATTAAAYTADYAKHWAHSMPYNPHPPRPKSFTPAH